MTKKAAGKKKMVGKKVRPTASDPEKVSAAIPEQEKLWPQGLRWCVDVLTRILKTEGDIPVVVHDTVGVHGSLKSPKVKILDYWDVVDSNLPAGEVGEEGGPPQAEPFQAGTKVVVLEMVD